MYRVLLQLAKGIGESFRSAAIPSLIQRSVSFSFVLASTQELHEKISELANRVRSLEDALRADHAQLTSEPHPLLNEDLLKIKAPLQREVPTFRSPPSNQTKDEEGGPEVVDAFGSLSISLSGRTKYFGHSANSWVSVLLFSFPSQS